MEGALISFANVERDEGIWFVARQPLHQIDALVPDLGPLHADLTRNVKQKSHRTWSGHSFSFGYVLKPSPSIPARFRDLTEDDVTCTAIKVIPMT